MPNYSSNISLWGEKTLGKIKDSDLFIDQGSNGDALDTP